MATITKKQKQKQTIENQDFQQCQKDCSCKRWWRIQPFHTSQLLINQLIKDKRHNNKDEWYKSMYYLSLTMGINCILCNGIRSASTKLTKPKSSFILRRSNYRNREDCSSSCNKCLGHSACFQLHIINLKRWSKWKEEHERQHHGESLKTIINQLIHDDWWRLLIPWMPWFDNFTTNEAI